MKVTLPGGQVTQKTVKRQQYPLTAAYAFTDYRSQGQMLPYVIVDIGTPPTGGLSLFNLYVALSRSSGPEDNRLEELDRKTKEWWGKMTSTQQEVEEN
ncbi:hypothetical protein C8F04DRAFT_959572 [Mycena alexandri]|uniref:Uncharacterized protein n=1 Tax=Mycena alexandri TaxID=1745969 RepID=A0AAD6SR86_9AGAR|nr:hypothetical protein C8F04DRAFT_959572 [Mycena alexandri]